MEITYAEVIYQHPVFSIVWLDEAKTISAFLAHQRWTWDDALLAFEQHFTVTSALNYPFYTVFIYGDNGLMPTGGNAISTIRKLMLYEMAHERLVIFVGQNTSLIQFIRVTTKIYGFSRMLTKYRFVPTLEDCIAHVNTDKTKLKQF